MDEAIRKVLAERRYTPTLPWEMDDALYYVRLTHPEATEGDVMRVYNEMNK
jgi:hypothetical protein